MIDVFLCLLFSNILATKISLVLIFNGDTNNKNFKGSHYHDYL